MSINCINVIIQDFFYNLSEENKKQLEESLDYLLSYSDHESFLLTAFGKYQEKVVDYMKNYLQKKGKDVKVYKVDIKRHYLPLKDLRETYDKVKDIAKKEKRKLIIYDCGFSNLSQLDPSLIKKYNYRIVNLN